MGIRYLTINTTLTFAEGLTNDERREIQDEVTLEIQAKMEKMFPLDHDILDHVTGATWSSTTGGR